MHITRLSKASPQVILNSLFSPNWRSMFIGKAGAGKTYVLRNAGSEYNITLLGPSNLAAMVLGGQTLCSWLGVMDLTPKSLASIDVDRLSRKLVALSMDPSCIYKGIYIDEMSFFNTELFHFLDKVFEQVNVYLLSEGLPIIYLIWGGDFLQLETIEGNPIYTSPLITQYNITITQDVYRQSEEVWKECLNAIREGRSDDVKDYFRDPYVQRTQLTNTLLKTSALGPKGVHIVGKQEDVYLYSSASCNELARENKAPRYAYWNGYTKARKYRYLHLTKGIRVKAGKNDHRNQIVKGLFGTVQDCSKDTVEVLFDNGVEHTYKYSKESQLWLEPGGVCTVHSIQGLTIPKGSIALIDLLSSFTACTKGGLYVATSRTENAFDTMLVVNKWSDIGSRILTDKEVISKGLY